MKTFINVLKNRKKWKRNKKMKKEKEKYSHPAYSNVRQDGY